MENIQAIIQEHTAFCNLGQETLYKIDPTGKREQEIIERLFEAYQQHLQETATDEQLEEWYDMDDSDKFETIVEETA